MNVGQAGALDTLISFLSEDAEQHVSDKEGSDIIPIESRKLFC